MKKKNFRLSVESLEDRTTPSAWLDANSILHAAVDTTGGTHTVVATPGANTGDVNLKIDGQTQSFSGVASLELRGAVKGSNYIENNTALPATLTGVGKADTIFGGTGPDVINAGPGKEILYDLFNTNTINAKNGRSDYIFTNASSTVNSNWNDKVVSFFAANRTPGAGTVVVENGVLYLSTNNAAVTTTRLSNSNGGYLLTYNWGNGTTTQWFNRDQVKIVAYFGGTGNDTFVNDTKLSQSAYGGVGTGSDVLVGGFGELDILKGLAGSDILVGRASINDLSNSGSSVPDGSIDYLFGYGQTNVFRAGPEDMTFSRKCLRSNINL